MAHLGSSDCEQFMRTANPHVWRFDPDDFDSRDSYDHACCGNVAKVELFCLAADSLRSESLRTRAWNMAQRICSRADHLELAFPGGNANFCPGFFNGCAGIGYSMLRLAYPGLLPSVLLFESTAKSRAVRGGGSFTPARI